MTLELRKKILIVDTEAGPAGELKAFLEENNYSVRHTADYPQSMTVIQNWKPDLVILNILIQAFNPIDFISDIRKNPFTENQKIIIFSKTPKTEIVTGPSPRVKGYLTKPIDFEELKAALARALSGVSALEQPTVMIADDDEEFSDLVKMFLEANNCKPVMVSDSRKVLEMLKITRPKALLLDLMMPGMNGFQIMEEMQDEAETAKIPIIVLSGLRLDNFQECGIITGLPEIVARDLPKDLMLKLIKDVTQSDLVAPHLQNEPRKDILKPSVLIADDQTELLMLMKETIEDAGFEVFTASDGQEALKVIFETIPDIIVLDYNMPIKDGLSVAQILKDNPLFAHIPIIICTAHSEKSTRMRGFSMGIDDYLIKPVDTDELTARIRMILKRNKLVLDANPLSKLPGNPSIQARVEREIQKKLPFAVLYLDLNNFKAYNDTYGFEAGDRVLKATANLLVKLAIRNENAEEFIGHIGGDDFIIVTRFEKAENLAKRITAAFDEIAPSFYSKEDRERRTITSTDRQGNIKKFPFLSISIGIVHNCLRPLQSFAQVSNIGAELKKVAKAAEKSHYVIDRRKD
ncbi:MAG TPA: hypothetical protein DCL44_06100 [Elusimicrobia bacterium]|nr:hypothetical protein [Elusimicrobiota bacterium]